MTDSLKFGPEWLRNLTQPAESGLGGAGGGPTSSMTPRYQLAEYRYGREEMLAMFGNIKPIVPEGLDSFPMLFLEKPLPPLALIQMTEEETRMWQRGINSEGAGRATGYGRGSGPIPAIGGRGLPLQNTTSYGPGIGRGRGGRFSNGRGRFEEDTPREPGGFPINNYAARGRFERSVSGQERTWSEKGGGGAEWNGGSVSPRRELKPFFGKPPIDNWRNNGVEGPEEAPAAGRRPPGPGGKWNRNNSWREGGGKDRDDWHGDGDHGYKYQDMENDKDGTNEKRYGIDPNFKILDAIREVKENSQRKEELAKELDELNKKVKYYEEQEKSGSIQIADYAASFTKKHSIQSDLKKLCEFEENLIEKIKHHLAHNPKAAEMGMEPHGRRHTDHDLPEWATTNPEDEGGSFDERGVFFFDLNSDNGVSPLHKPNSEPSPDRLNEGHKNTRNRVEEERKEEVKMQQPKQVSHVKPLMPQFEQEQELKKQASKNAQNKDQQQPLNILPLILGVERSQSEKWPEKLVDDVIKDDVVQPPSQTKEELWYYLDPQGFEQGKFSSEQMLAWNKSGFFPANLQVRRETDTFFADICQFPTIWEQAKPVPEPVHNEVPLISAALNASSGGSPSTNVAKSPGKVIENVRDIQAEFVLRQYEEMERMRFERLSFENEDGYITPDESFEAKNFDKQMIWNELKKEKERRDMHKGLGGSYGSYMPLDPTSYPGLKPTLAWITQWIQKQCTKLASGKRRFSLEEKELLILFKMHEKKVELAEKEREEQNRKTVMRVLPTVAPAEPNWHMPSSGLPESVWGPEAGQVSAPAAAPHSLWGDIDPIPMPQSGGPATNSLWGLSNSNGLPHPRQQFTGQFDKVEADALELEKLAAEATSRRDMHRREENLRIQKEIEAAKRSIEKKRMEDEKKMQEEYAEKQRQEMMMRQLEMEKERMLMEQEMQRKKAEEEAALQLEMERKAAEEEAERRREEERRKKNKKAQEEAQKKQLQQQQQQQAAARKKEIQSVQQVEAQMKLQKQEQLKKQQQEQLKLQQEQLEMQRQLEIQRQQEMRKQQEMMMELQRKKAAETKAANAIKAAKTAPWLQQAASMKNSVASLADIQKLQKEETQREIAAVQEQRSKLQKELSLEEPFKPWEGARSGQTLLNIQQIQEEQRKSRLEAAALNIPMPVAPPIVNSSSNTWNSAWTQATPQTAGIWGPSVTSSPSVSSKVISKPTHASQPAPKPVAMPASIWNADPEPAHSAPVASQKASASASATKKKPGKSKSKKEEAQVMKIFESKKSFSDEFTAWCVKSLSALESDVDIPTFVGFLKDIESPYEINDYVRSYLGTGQDAREFAKNFVERRSKWRNAQKKAVAEDDMCKPAPAINPNDSEFVEGKVKKIKKKPMFKVDSRILGFNVTAAPDRLNVGDRDYGEQ